MSPNDLAERLLDFAARAAKVVDALPDTRLGRHVGGQLVRCGTAAAPNYEEACAGESRADFAHKMSICLKELRETRLWLRLIVKTDLLPEKRIGPLLDEADALCKIFGKSLATTRRTSKSKRADDEDNQD